MGRSGGRDARQGPLPRQRYGLTGWRNILPPACGCPWLGGAGGSQRAPPRGEREEKLDGRRDPGGQRHWGIYFAKSGVL